ncbi:MAG: MFS transporter [Anaerolineae bacterium]|nr:MFS transporter [Anaerolineae bacterium]MCI0607696.1 MFS transporter [Anaerolineae bacterium]
MSNRASAQENSGRWRMLTLMSIVLVLSVSTWFSAAAVLPQLRELWELDPTTSAWLTIAVQVGFVCGAIVSSLFNLADILAPRHVIFGGAAGAAIANLLLDVAGGPAIGIPLRFATGFFIAGVYPPAFKLMSTWFREGRGLALGILAGALVVGNGLPHLVNGFGGLDWQVVIYSTSGLTLLGGLIAEFSVKQGPYPFPAAVFDPKQIRLVFANRSVRLATLGYVGHMWELFAMSAWFLVFFADALRARGLAVGSVAAFVTYGVFLAGGLGCWLGGVMADRWGRTRTTIWMMSVSGACAILIGLFFGSSPWLILVIGLLWGFSSVADSAQFSTMVTELADQAYVGTALTLQLAAGFTITVATIWLIPILETAIGWRWAFAFLAPGPIVGILAMLRLKSLPEATHIAGGKGR